MGFFSGGIGFNLVTLLVAVLALVVGGFGAYYARRTLFPPKRRLTYIALPPTSLLSDDSATTKGVEVRYEGEELKNPYLTTMYIENTGRHAVTSAQFDQSRPSVFDLDVPIKAVSKIAVIPGSGAGYEHSISGSELHLGPDLLNPGQSLVVQLLTEGRPKTDDLEERSNHYLGDTKIEFKDRHPTVREQSRSFRVWTLAGALFSTISIVASLIVMYSATGISVSLAPDNGPPGSQVILTGDGAERFAVIEVDTGSVGFPVRTSSSTTSPSSATTSAVQYAKLELAETQADEAGRFQVAFTMPEKIAKGEIELVVTIDEGGSTAYEYVKFFVR